MRPPRSMLLPAALLIGGAVPFLAGTEHTNAICVMSSSGCFDSYQCTVASGPCSGGGTIVKKLGISIPFGNCVTPFPPNTCSTSPLPCYEEKFFKNSGCTDYCESKWNMTDACQS